MPRVYREEGRNKIAFMVWALAVPPLVTSDAGKIVTAFGALLVSTLLSLVGAAVKPPEA